MARPAGRAVGVAKECCFAKNSSVKAFPSGGRWIGRKAKTDEGEAQCVLLLNSTAPASSLAGLQAGRVYDESSPAADEEKEPFWRLAGWNKAHLGRPALAKNSGKRYNKTVRPENGQQAAKRPCGEKIRPLAGFWKRGNNYGNHG